MAAIVDAFAALNRVLEAPNTSPGFIRKACAAVEECLSSNRCGAPPCAHAGSRSVPDSCSPCGSLRAAHAPAGTTCGPSSTCASPRCCGACSATTTSRAGSTWWQRCAHTQGPYTSARVGTLLPHRCHPAGACEICAGGQGGRRGGPPRPPLPIWCVRSTSSVCCAKPGCGTASSWQQQRQWGGPAALNTSLGARRSTHLANVPVSTAVAFAAQQQALADTAPPCLPARCARSWTAGRLAHTAPAGRLFASIVSADTDQLIQFIFPLERLPGHTQVTPPPQHTSALPGPPCRDTFLSIQVARQLLL